MIGIVSIKTAVSLIDQAVPIGKELGMKVTSEIHPLEDKVIYSEEHKKHLSFIPTTVVFVRNDLGEIEIRTCTSCGYEDVTCLHTKNDIDFELLKIRCLLCGG